MFETDSYPPRLSKHDKPGTVLTSHQNTMVPGKHVLPDKGPTLQRDMGLWQV